MFMLRLLLVNCDCDCCTRLNMNGKDVLKAFSFLDLLVFFGQIVKKNSNYINLSNITQTFLCVKICKNIKFYQSPSDVMVSKVSNATSIGLLQYSTFYILFFIFLGSSCFEKG